MAEIKDNKLFVDGYVYYRSRKAAYLLGLPEDSRSWMKCPNNNKRSASRWRVVLFKGPAESFHDHPPSREKLAAVAMTQELKGKAAGNPGEPPSRILRSDLVCVSTGVLSQLQVQTIVGKIWTQIWVNRALHDTDLKFDILALDTLSRKFPSRRKWLHPLRPPEGCGSPPKHLLSIFLI